MFFFFQAEDGIRDLVRSRGLGDVYKRQLHQHLAGLADAGQQLVGALRGEHELVLRPRPLLALSLIHI